METRQECGKKDKTMEEKRRKDKTGQSRTEQDGTQPRQERTIWNQGCGVGWGRDVPSSGGVLASSGDRFGANSGPQDCFWMDWKA